jgi:hypothetical protein
MKGHPVRKWERSWVVSVLLLGIFLFLLIAASNLLYVLSIGAFAFVTPEMTISPFFILAAGAALCVWSASAMVVLAILFERLFQGPRESVDGAFISPDPEVLLEKSQ